MTIVGREHRSFLMIFRFTSKAMYSTNKNMSLGRISLLENGTSMIKMIPSDSFFNWGITFLGNMLLSCEALIQHLYKDWLHLYRVTRTLCKPNYSCYLSTDLSQGGCFSFVRFWQYTLHLNLLIWEPGR